MHLFLHNDVEIGFTKCHGSLNSKTQMASTLGMGVFGGEMGLFCGLTHSIWQVDKVGIEVP